MLPISLSQALTLYTWFPLTALLFILLLVARFYERFSGRRTYYRWYVVPMFSFGVSAVRYTSHQLIIGDPIGDLALTVAGAFLVVLLGRLSWLMLLKNPAQSANTPPAMALVAGLGASSFLGPVSLLGLMCAFGLLSRRLGRVTHARPYYLLFFASAILIGGAVVIRLWAVQLAESNIVYDNSVWAVVYNALIALAVTLGLSSAWRYWSWLLAERD